MAAMESLRLALTPFPALVASAPPSRIDRQLREVAAALAALLSPQETDAMLPEQQAAQEDAVHRLLDTFCRAHAEDHMSDYTKLGSWRLPYVAMLHSHTSLHLPLLRQLELSLLDLSGASLGPAQCSALCTFMVFMTPCQVSPRDDVSGEMHESSTDAGVLAVHIASPGDAKSADDRPAKGIQIGRTRRVVRALFEWRWESCFGTRQEQGQRMESKTETDSAHWMDQFCDAFRMDSAESLLWATRFAASYLRNVAVYWEHLLVSNGCRETWLLTDSAPHQLENITLVVAFVPRSMVIFLVWLQQRLDFAFHFGASSEPQTLKKAFALCEAVLASPVGALLRSINAASLSLSKAFEFELRTGWKDWILSKSRRSFLRSVVWGCTGAPDGFAWGLLWTQFEGDRARACTALTTVFLTSHCNPNARSDGTLERSWSGAKKQCRDTSAHSLSSPHWLWRKESEASPAEVVTLQILLELSSNQSGPWFLEVAFDCLGEQARLENALLVHSEACAFVHQCKSRHYNARACCSAHRLKSCIAALPPSHCISHERLDKMERVFVFCWLGDGPFSIDFTAQLLSHFQTSQTSGVFLKAENQWSTFLLATWVRFFNVVGGAPILSLHHAVGGIDLGSILAHLHTTQQFLLTSSTRKVGHPDFGDFKAAAAAMPQLAAVMLIESLFTSFCFTTSLSLRDGFLAKLATEASSQQHEVAARVVDLLRRVTTTEVAQQQQGPRVGKDHHEATAADAPRSFLEFLFFDLIDLLSMAPIECPDLILTKWTALEYKRKRVTEGVHDPKAATLVSLASIEWEFDERIGQQHHPRRSVWDVLLEWAVTVLTLRPDDSIRVVEAPGPKALAVTLVVAALPRDTVLCLGRSTASWTVLLSQTRTGLENGFRRLSLVDRSCDLSAVKAEMDSYLLRLQEICTGTPPL